VQADAPVSMHIFPESVSNVYSDVLPGVASIYSIVRSSAFVDVDLTADVVGFIDARMLLTLAAIHAIEMGFDIVGLELPRLHSNVECCTFRTALYR